MVFSVPVIELRRTKKERKDELSYIPEVRDTWL